ncbi:MAG: S41 family peptidase [Chthoniobacterales bacterium]
MSRSASSFLTLLFFCWAGLAAFAQSPTPPPAAPANPTVTPSPAPSAEAIINSMAPADLQQVIQLLKSNYINPAALNEAELNRAMLSGVLDRLGGGALLLSVSGAEGSPTADAFYSDVIEGHIGYLRFGALTPANLQALDTALQGYPAKKIDAVVVDLRASGATNDFATAAEFAKRFCGKGKALFSLRRAAGKLERPFVSERDPAYTGLLLVLVDGETAGPAEAIAGDLRHYNKALLIGQPTAGRAVEYSDLPLNGGRILRTAVSEAVLPEGKAIFPGGLKPDLAVEMTTADKRQVFQQSVQVGMSPFVFEHERPHLNEAALLAGQNPELDALEATQRRKNAEKPLPRDVVLQRAIDLVTSLAIYQKR